MTRAGYLVHLSYQKEIIMNKTWLKRLGAASGVLYVVLAIIGSSGNDTDPGFNATPQVITAWAKSVQLTPSFWISPYIELLGLLFFLVFVAYLYSVLSRAEGAFGWLSATVFASGIATVVLKLTAFPIAAAAFARAADGFNPQVLAILWDMDNISLLPTLATQAFLLGAAAIVILRAKALPAWLGWSAALIAVILLGTVPVAFFNAIPVQLIPLLWVLVASIVLILRAGKVQESRIGTTQHVEEQSVVMR
jgi:hypothetical protein